VGGRGAGDGKSLPLLRYFSSVLKKRYFRAAIEFDNFAIEKLHSPCGFSRSHPFAMFDDEARLRSSARLGATQGILGCRSPRGRPKMWRPHAAGLWEAWLIGVDSVNEPIKNYIKSRWFMVSKLRWPRCSSFLTQWWRLGATGSYPLFRERLRLPITQSLTLIWPTKLRMYFDKLTWS